MKQEENVLALRCGICKREAPSDDVMFLYWQRGFPARCGAWKKIPGYCCQCVDVTAQQLNIMREDVDTYFTARRISAMLAQQSPEHERKSKQVHNVAKRFVDITREILEKKLSYPEQCQEINDYSYQVLSWFWEGVPRKAGNLTHFYGRIKP